MPDVPTIPDLDEFDPKQWVKPRSVAHQAIRRLLEPLPRRAIVAFALRCAKRAEPVARLQPLIADACSAGLDINKVRRYDDTETAYAARTADYAGHAAVDADATAAADYAARTASVDDVTFLAAANIDVKKLRSLNLGQPGEPGEPIRWNDPRLGPLWPNGEPQWYTEAVQACRELEEKLRTLPDPDTPQLDPVLLAHFEDRAWLDQLQSEGKLSDYRGQYVIAAEREIFSHGSNLMKARRTAEKKAAQKNIPPARLVDYFVPGIA